MHFISTFPFPFICRANLDTINGSKANFLLLFDCDFLAYLLGHLKEESWNFRSFVPRMTKFNGAIIKFDIHCNVFDPVQLTF